MLTETLHSLAAATRGVFKNWKSMLLIAAVYAVLLVVLYLFLAIKEATLAQVTLTFVFAVAVPLIFFVLQAMIASGSVPPLANSPETNQVTAGFVLRRSLTSFWKLILVSLPLIALAILIFYLLAKAQNHFGQSPNDIALAPHPLAETANAQHRAQPLNWKAALFSTLRYLSLGLVLPLTAIHLWLATIHDGLGGALKRILTLLSRAFAPQSVLIYVAGFLIFAVVPYFLLLRTTQTKHAWLELFLLLARLAVVFALTLIGWMITVRALAQGLPQPFRDHAKEAT
ncbi:MAG TPA: hypothetical protein VK208_12165 [Pyrinomonadaceae bacterium]|jgi:hypothetical protein|nr:hypothetical protein [Pyrinomonadaceae bacterium]